MDSVVSSSGLSISAAAMLESEVGSMRRAHRQPLSLRLTMSRAVVLLRRGGLFIVRPRSFYGASLRG